MIKTSEITITRSLSDSIIEAMYIKDQYFAAEVDKCLNNWGYSGAEVFEDTRRQIFCLTNTQTELLLLKIRP